MTIVYKDSSLETIKDRFENTVLIQENFFKELI